MKCLVPSLFLVMLHILSVKAQQIPTYADLPKAENVLVVYNPNSDTSTLVKEYYRIARNIPSENICPLISLPTREILNYNGEDHVIKIVQSGDICSSLLDCSSG